MSCCSLLRTRDQSRSLRCGWETDAHPFGRRGRRSALQPRAAQRFAGLAAGFLITELAAMMRLMVSAWA